MLVLLKQINAKKRRATEIQGVISYFSTFKILL
jgi:hypothetical protein